MSFLLAVEEAATKTVMYTPSERLKILVCAGIMCVSLIICIGVLYNNYRIKITKWQMKQWYNQALELRQRNVTSAMESNPALTHEKAEEMFPQIPPPDELTNPKKQFSIRNLMFVIGAAVILSGAVMYIF